jgi:hypothetical protein
VPSFFNAKLKSVPAATCTATRASTITVTCALLLGSATLVAVITYEPAVSGAA